MTKGQSQDGLRGFCSGCRGGWLYGDKCSVCGWWPGWNPWTSDLSEYDARVQGVAAKYGLDPAALDWHLEAEHGWERHNLGYGDAAEGAALCLASNITHH